MSAESLIRTLFEELRNTGTWVVENGMKLLGVLGAFGLLSGSAAVQQTWKNALPGELPEAIAAVTPGRVFCDPAEYPDDPTWCESTEEEE